MISGDTHLLAASRTEATRGRGELNMSKGSPLPSVFKPIHLTFRLKRTPIIVPFVLIVFIACEEST